jgi:hypothetical protein
MPFQVSERMLSLLLMVARRSTRFDTTPKAISVYPYAKTQQDQAERKAE